MSYRPHARPPAWEGSTCLATSTDLRDGLEILISELVHSESPRDAAWGRGLRTRVHDALEHGAGLVMHDSAQLESLDRPAFYRTFTRLCDFLGRRVSINRAGDSLREVTNDEGAFDSVMTPKRGHRTNQALAFHSDRADVTVLACWSPALVGGHFRVCSSSRVVEIIDQAQPAWRRLLEEPIAHDLRDEGVDSGTPYALVPILTENEHTFVFRYIRKFNDSVMRHGRTLEPLAIQMLNDIDFILERPGLPLEYIFRKGSLALTNNHTTLHSRDTFVDGGDQKRCLLRSWLSSEFTRVLPDEFAPLFHCVRPGAHRGGVLKK